MPNGFPKGNFRIINQDTGVRLFAYDNGIASESIDTKSKTTHETGKIGLTVARNPVFKVGSPEDKDDDLWWFHQSKDSGRNSEGNYLMSHIDAINGQFALQVHWSEGDFSPEIENFRTTFFLALFNTHQILLAPLKDFPAKYLSLPDKEVTPDDIAKVIPFLVSEKLLSCSSEELSCLSLADLVREVSEVLSSIIPSDVPSKEFINEISSEFRRLLGEQCARQEAWLSLCGWGDEGVSKWQAEDGYIFLEGKREQVLTLVKNEESYKATLADRGASNQTWRFEPNF